MNALSLFNSEDDDRSLRGYRGDIDGLDVLVVHQGGQAVGVEYDSISAALGGLLPAHMVGYVKSWIRPEIVLVDGAPKRVLLLPLKEFFKFCQAHSSPKLDSFRERLADIAVSVQHRGGYIAPGATASAFLPPELEGDPQAQVLATLLQQRREQIQLAGQVKKVEKRVDELADKIGQGPQFIRIAAWFDLFGIKMDKAALAREGMRLREICVANGWPIPPKVLGHGQEAVRPWPRKAYDVWWPDYCRRVGRAVEWPPNA